jgi:hypothetical protein
VILRERPHLEKAKALCSACDLESLRYCCLELRLAIELICYERLAAYEKQLPDGALGRWRPQDVVDLITECDPGATTDRILRIGSEGTEDRPEPVVFQALLKGVSKRLLRDHYHWLQGPGT